MVAKSANVIARVDLEAKAQAEISKEELDKRIARGLEQAKAGQYLPLDEAFAKIDIEV